MKTIIGECLCVGEPFPATTTNTVNTVTTKQSLPSKLVVGVCSTMLGGGDSGGSLSSSQFIELHGIQFIGLGALEDELTAKERVYDTLEQLTSRTDRLISVGYLVESSASKQCDSPSQQEVKVEEELLRPQEEEMTRNITTQSIPLDVWKNNYPNDFTSRAIKKTITNIQSRNFEAALKDLQRTYDEQKRTPSKNGNSYMLGITVHNLGVVCVLAGKDTQALPLFEEAVTLKQSTFGPDHPEVAISLDELGIQLFGNERYQEAFDAFSQSHQILAKSYGPRHPGLSMVMNNMACCSYQMRHIDQALTLMDEAMAFQRETRKDNGSGGGSSAIADLELLQKAILLNNSGYLKVSVKRYDEARACFEEALLLQQSVLGDSYNHRAIRDSRANLEFTNVFHSEG
jgi:tetratricopeptide (TPR) repeat protein